jgi:hypothetical protein
MYYVEDFNSRKPKARSSDCTYTWRRKKNQVELRTDWIVRKKALTMTPEERTLSECYERSVAMAEVEEKIEAKFRRLASEWSESVRSVSSITAIINNPKYREIVSLGWDIVPYLLREVQERRGFWFPALAEITTIRPYDPRDAGNNKRMTEAWVKWGKLKRLI